MTSRTLLAAGATLAGVLALTVPAPGGVTPPAQAAGYEQPCGGQSPLKPTGGKYVCSFYDNFSGSRLDGSKWMAATTALSGVSSGNRDCVVNDSDNISLGGGYLRLSTQVERQPFVCKSPYGDFTTQTTGGSISSRGRFNQTFGRFEFRAKFPATTAPGVHSTLWLYPNTHTYGAWPKSGEIDVAEWFSGKASHVYPSVHYEGADPALRTGYNCVVPNASSTYHRYAVEWTSTMMRFYYDGQLCFEHAWTPSAPLTGSQPFDKPFNLVLSQVFGGAWNAVTSATPSRATMYVDWVRVWR